MAILYVASEASELKPFAAHLTGLRKLSWPLDYAYEGILDGRRIVLTANGAGPKLAAQAVEIAMRAVTVAELSSSRLEAVVNVGYCGALDPALKEGQIVMATGILDGSTGETLDCVAAEGGSVKGVVLSDDRVVNSPLDKQRLWESGLIAVEMEAAGVFARTRKADLPFFCIKSITDLADESFPLDLNQMRTIEGRFSRGRIGSYALTHPRALPGLFHLKRRSEQAARALGEFLVSWRIQVESPSTAGE